METLTPAQRGERPVWPGGEVLDPPGEDAGHCSAVVKLLADGSDLYFGQVTWAGFEDMTRVFKQYDLPYTLNGMLQGSSARTFSAIPALNGLDGASTVPSRRMAFSSDPGSLFSGDDFYTMSSGLAMLETTIGNNNASLYAQYVRPDTVLEWARNIVANRLAVDGPTWAAIFSAYNSGTYNNENLVVDFNKFTPARGDSAAVLQPGAIIGLDQIPGFIHWEDLTTELSRNGYVASYNVARFPDIYNVSGMQPLYQRYGPWFSFNDTARANIFRRDHVKVVDETSFRSLLRYNDFTHDPLSTQGCGTNPPYSAENAISARDDLNPSKGVYPISALGHRDHAAIDGKYTNAGLMMGGGARAPGAWEGGAQAISGPTYDTQAPFVWSSSPYSSLPHVGQPDEWLFPWTLMDWEGDSRG